MDICYRPHGVSDGTTSVQPPDETITTCLELYQAIQAAQGDQGRVLVVDDKGGHLFLDFLTHPHRATPADTTESQTLADAAQFFGVTD